MRPMARPLALLTVVRSRTSLVNVHNKLFTFTNAAAPYAAVVPAAARLSFGELKAGDELEIRVVGDTVSYHKNGALLHTSTRKPVFPLRADCSFFGVGARAEGVRLRLSARVRRSTCSASH